MNYSKIITLFFLVFTTCKTNEKKEAEFTIAFGSCNNQVLEF